MGADAFEGRRVVKALTALETYIELGVETADGLDAGRHVSEEFTDGAHRLFAALDDLIWLKLLDRDPVYGRHLEALRSHVNTDAAALGAERDFTWGRVRELGKFSLMALGNAISDLGDGLTAPDDKRLSAAIHRPQVRKRIPSRARRADRASEHPVGESP